MTYTVHVGDCLASLRQMPAESVNTCVTSPPYFGLRDYGHEGQIGLEDTPEAYVARLVEVFREVRRVLRDDGTLWLNLGDSYAANRSYQVPSTKGGPKHGPGQSAGGAGSVVPDGLKPKDLLGIPWRVAFALQADGWYLRQDIIWHKPNPMPESVTDRCTKAHEYIFLLSKSPRYYFDNEAIKEPGVIPAGTKAAKGSAERAAQAGVNSRPPEYKVYDGTRNRRSVWTVTTKPYKGAHFATFPPDLIEPCILAGCPVGGTVLDPFGGSGTTAGVAIKHGRSAVLCELNPDYAALIHDRVSSIAGGLFARAAE
jgi:DNA modification methylase